MVKPRKRYGETAEDFIKRASQEYYSNGYHINEIAFKLKCDIIDVYTAVTSDYKCRITTPEERDLMISMYNHGYSYSKIAKELGRSRQCVTSRIASAPQCHVEHGYNLTDREIEKMKKWYLEGKTSVWIARQLKCSEASIRRRLNKIGIYKFNYGYSIPLSNKDKNIIKKMYKNGCTVGEIADKTGRQPNLIYKFIKITFK